MKVVRLLALHRLRVVTITYFDLIHYLIGIFNMAPILYLIAVSNLASKYDIFYCTYAREYDNVCTLWFKLFFEIGIWACINNFYDIHLSQMREEYEVSKQWRIQRSDPAGEYIVWHCTIPLDLTSRSGLTIVLEPQPETQHSYSTAIMWELHIYYFLQCSDNKMVLDRNCTLY
jgi:hypothetical protein